MEETDRAIGIGRKTRGRGVPDAKGGFEEGGRGQMLQRPKERAGKGREAAPLETRVALKVAFLGGGGEPVWSSE